MAIALFTNKKPRIGPVRLDASITEEHKVLYQVTREPLESGTTYTDSILELPIPLEIVGAITLHTDSLIPTLSNTRHVQGWKALVELSKTRLPFTIVTSLARYRNMVIEELSTTRSKRNTNVVIIRCMARQLQLALVDDVANLADAAADIAAPAAELGDQGLGEVAA